MMGISRFFFAGVICLSSFSAQSATLDPVVAGKFKDGDGANSQWVQVANDWRGTTQGTEGWGTGIWSLTDAEDVLALAENASTGNSTAVVQTYSGRVNQIGFADAVYLEAWGATWGNQDLVPFFTNNAGEYQDNYAARFTGYISIPEAGSYNFGVLSDDGFRFSLLGSGNTSLSMATDGLNPRERQGFDQDLMLDAGLYGFDLLSYERWEAGVVNLAWSRPEGGWEPLTGPNLFTHIPAAVPEPATWIFMLAGLGLVLLQRRRVS